MGLHEVLLQILSIEFGFNLKNYFQLQFRLINRNFKDAGIAPLLVYLLMAFAFVSVSVLLFNKTKFGVIVYLLLAVTLVAKLSEIRRNDFLRFCFSAYEFRSLRIIENLIISLPFLFFLLYMQHYIFSVILILLTGTLALVDFRTTLNFTIPTPFSKRPFEFTIGFRNTFYIIIIAYLLVAISVIAHNFNLGIFSMLLIYAITLGYYGVLENNFYVWSYAMNARHFLFSKILTALLYSSYLVLPVSLVLGIAFSGEIGSILIVMLVGWFFNAFMIVSKYATYPGGPGIFQGVLIALCLSFPPVLIVLIPYLFRKSENRLGYLLKSE